MTLSEQIQHVRRRDKRPISLKGGNYREPPSLCEVGKVVDTQLCERPLSPPRLFVKDERTGKEKKKYSKQTLLYRTYSYPRCILNKYLYLIEMLWLADQPIYCEQSQTTVWLWSIVPIKLSCCCLLDHNICELHHTQTSSDIRTLVLAIDCARKHNHLPQSVQDIPLD